MKLRVLVVDDEKMARRRVVRLLESLGGCEVVAECRSGEEALRWLHPEHVDVALLDIDMPDMSGLQTAEVASSRDVPVIFLTAHEEHAVEAFARGAAHYLLKPIDAPRLEAALSRVRRATSPERIALTARDEVFLVEVAEISHALYDGQLVSVFAGGREFLSESSLQDLENKLAGGDFLRVHRRALIHVAFVDRLRSLPSGGYLALMRDGAEVPVSRQSARALRKRFDV